MKNYAKIPAMPDHPKNSCGTPCVQYMLSDENFGGSDFQTLVRAMRGEHTLQRESEVERILRALHGEAEPPPPPVPLKKRRITSTTKEGEVVYK